MKKRNYMSVETDRTDIDQFTDPKKQYVVAGRSTVAGKDLSNTRSSNRKGRKSATRPKKLEEQAE